MMTATPSTAAAPCELERAPCPLGCAAQDEPVFSGRDLLYGLPGEFTVVRCRGCGLMRTNPRPTPSAMREFYPDDYSPYVYTRVSGPPKRRRFRSGLTRLFELNTQRVPDIPPGHMLEIGCASGGFMDVMARKGWSAEGIEFSESAAAAARSSGFKVFSGRLEDAPGPERKYDLVIGWMVLEHLYEPAGALRRLREWTRPGAWLVISVPNAGSLEFTIFRDRWYAAQLPTHLFHYDTRTLGRLLAASGWRIEKVHHQRTLSNLFGSLGHHLRVRGRMPKLAAWLEKFPERARLEHYMLFPIAAILGAFGQTGRMTVWARRVDAEPSEES